MPPLPNALVPDLAGHAAYARVFQPGRLTLGFIAPLEAYPNAPWPTLADHAAMVRKADELDFAAIWLRDVPFYDPSFGDVGQILDPMVYAGWLAAQTTRIAIGTAGIVLPLRDPLIVAKQAATVDQLLSGRFLLGLSTGDRPSEFAAFNSDLDDRSDRYRDAIGVIRAATEQSFARHVSRHLAGSTVRSTLYPSRSDPGCRSLRSAAPDRRWNGSARTPTAGSGISAIPDACPMFSRGGGRRLLAARTSPMAMARCSICSQTQMRL